MSQLHVGAGPSNAWACPGEHLGPGQASEEGRGRERELEEVLARFSSTYYVSLVASIGRAANRVYLFIETVKTFKVKLDAAHLLTHHEISKLSTDFRNQLMAYLMPTFVDTDRIEDSQVLLATVLNAGAAVPLSAPAAAAARAAAAAARRRPATRRPAADGVLGELQRSLQHVARWVSLDPHPYSQLGDNERRGEEKKTKTIVKMRKPPQWKSYKKLEEDIESTEQATGVEAQPPAATSGKFSSSTVTQPPPPSPITDSGSESSQLSYETAFVDASGNTPASANNSKGEGAQAWYETKGISQDEQSPVESKGSDPPRTTDHHTPALVVSDGVQLVSATASQPVSKEASVHVGTNGEGTELEPVPIGASQEGAEAVPAPKPIGEGTKSVTAHIGASGEGAEVVSAPAPSGAIEDEAKPALSPVCIGASAHQEETVPVPTHVKVRGERAKSVPLPITFEAVGEGDEPVSLPMSVGVIGEGAEPVTAPMPMRASAGGAEPTLIPHEAGPTRTWVRGVMSTLLQVVRAARPSVPASAPDSPADSVAAGVGLRVRAAEAPAVADVTEGTHSGQGNGTGNGNGNGNRNGSGDGDGTESSAVSAIKPPSVGRRPITPYSTAREVLEEVQRQHGIFRSALLRHANRLWLEVRGRPETEAVPAAALDAKEALLSRFRDTLSHVDVELREAQRQMERRAQYVAALGDSAWSGRRPCVATQFGGGSGLDLAGGLHLQPAFSPPPRRDRRDASEHSCGRFFRVLCSCFICIPRRQ
ncbi:mucin-4-like [Schistocerca gregaria]|uniref:mucin-4-like n=1 Tax=Schistocerca gregaria TaxID=7010 RepID=UPI00211DC76E|nr:mucin-4-like [Schistocerca gregaria]